MKYIEYITNAANSAQQFGSDCLNWAGDVAAAIPEKAAEIGTITAEYTAAAAAASSDFVAAASYESYNAIMNAASQFADAMGDAVVNAPSYAESLAGMAADYSAAAIAAAQSYLASLENENNLQWIQKQDDGVYVSGDGGTSGGAGASGGWDTPEDWPKYPEGVPLVPPQIIPTGKTKIRKFQPPSDTMPKGCLNKRDPKIGEIIGIQTTNPVSDVFWVLYWDNISFYSQSKSLGAQPVYHEQFKATPAAIPLFADVAKFASLPLGRYAIESVSHNEAVLPMGSLSEFYDTVERWGWQYHSWGTITEETHSSEYHECISIEFGDYSGMYFFPVKTINGDSQGSGAAIHYKLGRIQMRYLGSDFPPVTETTDTTTTGAYLAFQQIHAFNNILFTLVGGNHGKS